MGDERIKILLIEDNPGDIRLIQEMLAETEPSKFELKCADRLSTGLEHLAKEEINVVLLDLGLPGDQGLGTLCKVCALAPEVSIVVVTGLKDETLAVQAMRQGAQDYLVKGDIDSKTIWRSIRYSMERKRAEEREKQLQRELSLTSRLAIVGQMASGIAHEINNPLAGVIGFADLLQKQDIPEDIRKEVDIIHDGAKRIASITDRMLSFARQHKPERTSVNINDIIENTLAMRAYEMKSSTIKVKTRLDPDLPSTVADAGQLQQVFLNIILNAEIEMTTAHGGGTLTVKTERIDDIIRISFKDDGPGIAKKNMERLFEPFFTTRGVGKGTGLGLSVCYGIVSQHGGQIYVESRLGKGATFIVELPIFTEAEQLKLVEPVAEEPEKVTRAGARILLVDDEPLVQELLTNILSEEGHEIEIIDNGNDARERLGGEDYDVILLDVKIPGISGIELFRHIQKETPSLTEKVIFITGDIMDKDTMDFLSKTGVSYNTKPFDIERLMKDINRICD